MAHKWTPYTGMQISVPRQLFAFLKSPPLAPIQIGDAKIDATPSAQEA